MVSHGMGAEAERRRGWVSLSFGWCWRRKQAARERRGKMTVTKQPPAASEVK